MVGGFPKHMKVGRLESWKVYSVCSLQSRSSVRFRKQKQLSQFSSHGGGARADRWREFGRNWEGFLLGE